MYRSLPGNGSKNLIVEKLESLEKCYLIVRYALISRNVTIVARAIRVESIGRNVIEAFRYHFSLFDKPKRKGAERKDVCLFLRDD